MTQDTQTPCTCWVRYGDGPVPNHENCDVHHDKPWFGEPWRDTQTPQQPQWDFARLLAETPRGLSFNESQVAVIELALKHLNAQQRRIQAAERELEEATVKLAYVNVWWQMADADVESVTRESVVALSKVLDGRDRTWLEEANAKTYRVEALEAALRFYFSDDADPKSCRRVFAEALSPS